MMGPTKATQAQLATPTQSPDGTRCRHNPTARDGTQSEADGDAPPRTTLPPLRAGPFDQVGSPPRLPPPLASTSNRTRPALPPSPRSRPDLCPRPDPSPGASHPETGGRIRSPWGADLAPTLTGILLDYDRSPTAIPLSSTAYPVRTPHIRTASRDLASRCACMMRLYAREGGRCRAADTSPVRRRADGLPRSLFYLTASYSPAILLSDGRLPGWGADLPRTAATLTR